MLSDKVYEKFYVDWTIAWEWAKEISHQIFCAGAKPEVILAVGKGGLIPAAMVNYLLSERTQGTPRVECVHALSYHGQIRGEVVTAGLYEVADRLSRYRHNGQILIVDDIADSGFTLNHLLLRFPRASTAVLIHKEKSIVKPTFFGTRDNSDRNTWYVFPWEQGAQ